MSNFTVPRGFVECPPCKGTGNIRLTKKVINRCDRCDGYGYHRKKTRP